MLSALKQWFSPSDAQLNAHGAYVAVTAQARQPVFFQQWGVQDDIDGRFDIIVLHVCLLLERLEAEAASTEAGIFMRGLTEAFFDDMDRSLREMGVSDTGVGHRVKKMAQAFYGRRKAYGEAQGDETRLAEVLKRNVYREREVDAACVASLAAYMGRNRAQLAKQPLGSLLAGQVSFSN